MRSTQLIIIFVGLFWLGAPVCAEQPLLPSGLVERPAERQAAPSGDARYDTAQLMMKLKGLEDTIEKLDAEMEVFKAQTGMLIGRSQLSFRNATYVKGGFTILFPRYSTFDFKLFGYGIGVFAGVGQYIGTNHVFELEFASDMILAATLRYRFEFHFSSPLLTFGPVVGYRVRIGKTLVDDSYLEKPNEVKQNFIVVGWILGIPVSKAVINVELDYITNRQSAIYANAALHFFF